MKLVFISLNLFYEYYVDFDWCRKVPGTPARVRTACTRLVGGRTASERLGTIFPRCRMVLDTAEK